MTGHTRSRPDPLIDEVRRRRRELFADCANDLHKLGELIRKRQAEHPHKIVDRRENKPQTMLIPE